MTQASARRLRGQLAERNISGLMLANMTGLGRSTIDRRLRGLTALNTDELEAIERATGISAVYLLTGQMHGPPHLSPDGGDALGHVPASERVAGRGQVRRQGLEPRTR